MSLYKYIYTMNSAASATWAKSSRSISTLKACFLERETLHHLLMPRHEVPQYSCQNFALFFLAHCVLRLQARSGDGPEVCLSLVQLPSLAHCMWRAGIAHHKPGSSQAQSGWSWLKTGTLVFVKNPTTWWEREQRSPSSTSNRSDGRPQCHAPAAAVSLDVLGQVIAAHEAPITELTAETLLARVCAAMSRQLVRTRESSPAACPLAAERPLACVRADVRLQMGALEVCLAAAGIAAHIRAPALFGHWSRGGIDEQRCLDRAGNEKLNSPDRNKCRLHEGFVGSCVHHGEKRRGGRLGGDGYHGPCRLLTYGGGQCDDWRRWAGARWSTDDHRNGSAGSMSARRCCRSDWIV